MGFVAISLDKYVKMYLTNKPLENEDILRKKLQSALMDYKNGIKCRCGNDIWVIGSAFTGNACFTCITGESFPNDDFEIDTAVIKHSGNKNPRNIDSMEKDQINGLFDDDGFEINTELIKKPSLCLICICNDDPEEELLCNMNRYDQRNDKEFKCYAYRKKTD